MSKRLDIQKDGPIKGGHINYTIQDGRINASWELKWSLGFWKTEKKRGHSIVEIGKYDSKEHYRQGNKMNIAGNSFHVLRATNTGAIISFKNSSSNVSGEIAISFLDTGIKITSINATAKVFGIGVRLRAKG